MQGSDGSGHSRLTIGIEGSAASVARRLVRRYRLEVHGRHGPVPRPDRWAFVMGCSNSGTSLLRNLLGQSASVGTMPAEGQLVTDQLVTPGELGLERLWALHPEVFRMTENDGKDIDVQRLKRQWRHRFNDWRRPVLLDDSPPNAARARWLQRHFDPAYFIWIVRDGRAVAEGIRRRAGHPIDLAAEQWVRANEMVAEDLPFLDHVHHLRYEDLCEHPDAAVGEALRFVGVDPGGLTVSDRAWRFHGQHLPIESMDEQAIARLSSEDLEVVESVAGRLLKRFGYLG